MQTESRTREQGTQGRVITKGEMKALAATLARLIFWEDNMAGEWNVMRREEGKKRKRDAEQAGEEGARGEEEGGGRVKKKK